MKCHIYYYRFLTFIIIVVVVVVVFLGLEYLEVRNKNILATGHQPPQMFMVSSTYNLRTEWGRGKEINYLNKYNNRSITKKRKTTTTTNITLLI